MKSKTHLVTTADERTWNFDKKNIFLGEWCKLDDRRHIWEAIEAELAAPFGVKAKKKKADTKYVFALSNKILNDLTIALNTFHETNHNNRYWNILLGHWLQRFVAVLFNRYFTLEQAFSNYELISTTVLDPKDFSLATPDSLSFIYACNDDIWNNVLYSKLLNYITTKINIEVIVVKNFEGYVVKNEIHNSYKDNMKRLFRKTAENILARFSKSNDAFIIQPYIPILQAIKLQISLRQVPQLWESPISVPSCVDIGTRKNLNISDPHAQGFEKLVRDFLPEMIPTCYIEGYSSLVKLAESLPWPNNPKFIFTSNCFDIYEVFKAWTGMKIEKGVPYYVGQHGNYQAFPDLLNAPEMVSSDKFLTWGWETNNPKHIPAFIFNKLPLRQKITSSGGLLLIEYHAPNFVATHDVFYEFSIYQEQQFVFVEELLDGIKNELTVRLHSYRQARWSIEKRWADRMPSIDVETGLVPFSKLIKECRLVVFSYDSTGLLQTLTSNIPTIAFWQNGFDQLPDNAKPLYQLLVDCGIVHFSPTSAAKQVNSIWDSIDDWWSSPAVQNARNQFCSRYARESVAPVRELKEILLKS
jgi:putative transferase (TIGR04331 family)